MIVKVFSDAATNPQTKLSASGAVIINNGQQTQIKTTLPVDNNHEAEFLAAIWVFEQLQARALAQPIDTIMYYTDSRIVADAIGKGYAKHFNDLMERLTNLVDQYHLVVTEWLPEKQNQGAHRLALQALHSTR